MSLEGDIFLNTTNVDNAPVTVVEAMACGLCIVSTDAGGVPDLVEDEHEALLVPCERCRRHDRSGQADSARPGLWRPDCPAGADKAETFALGASA